MCCVRSRRRDWPGRLVIGAVTIGISNMLIGSNILCARGGGGKCVRRWRTSRAVVHIPWTTTATIFQRLAISNRSGLLSANSRVCHEFRLNTIAIAHYNGHYREPQKPINSSTDRLAAPHTDSHIYRSENRSKLFKVES